MQRALSLVLVLGILIVGCGAGALAPTADPRTVPTYPPDSQEFVGQYTPTGAAHNSWYTYTVSADRTVTMSPAWDRPGPSKSVRIPSSLVRKLQLLFAGEAWRELGPKHFTDAGVVINVQAPPHYVIEASGKTVSTDGDAPPAVLRDILDAFETVSFLASCGDDGADATTWKPRPIEIRQRGLLLALSEWCATGGQRTTLIFEDSSVEVRTGGNDGPLVGRLERSPQGIVSFDSIQHVLAEPEWRSYKDKYGVFSLEVSTYVLAVPGRRITVHGDVLDRVADPKEPESPGSIPDDLLELVDSARNLGRFASDADNRGLHTNNSEKTPVRTEVSYRRHPLECELRDVIDFPASTNESVTTVAGRLITPLRSRAAPCPFARRVSRSGR